jgi:pentatricopeptide repeat protein
MDSFFIQALVRAASCPQHAKHISTHGHTAPPTLSHHKARRKSLLDPNQRRHYKSTRAGKDGPLGKVRQFAEKELKALVDYYGMNLEIGPEEEPPDDGPLVWNVGSDHQPWPVKEAIHTEYIKELKHLLENEETPNHVIFYCYKRLPAPGVVYLSDKTIRSLLHHLSVVERATQVSMQRFLSILDDMKNSHIHITRAEWTSAIYFAGRFMGKVSADELQSALYLWRDMEKRAGVRGGRVTLNVLFDVAVKAGKFTLADTFLKEMLARKLTLHRHFRVSLLYYYGVLQDGDAVRKTYQELVTSGDVVDTVVMNAVIAALIRAGEPAAAEHVFERMKRLHASKTAKHQNNAPQNWRERRKLGLHLTYKSLKLPEPVHKEKRTEIQEVAPIAPDSRTYGLIIRHFAATVGNIDRVTELLEEMRHNETPIDGTIFIVVLYGFNSFGGVRYTSWTRDKLEQIWVQFLKSVKDGVQRTWLSSMSVIVALKAFMKCTDAERTLKAWEEVSQVWEPNSKEKEDVIRVLRGLVPDHRSFDSTGNRVDRW